MQLYFIRHAQSANNALWAATGSEVGRSFDPGLTTLGQQQAQRVAESLSRGDPTAPTDERDTQNRASFGLTHLYTSLMTRAVATAIPIADALDLTAQAWPDLHEGGGLYLDDPATGQPVGQAGPNREHFEINFPHLLLPAELGAAGWWNRPYESQEDRLPRAQRAWRELRERHGQTNDRVGVVSHGAFYNYFLMVILGLPQRNGFWFALNNTAITRLDIFEGHVDLVYQNRADHLPPEMIT